MKNVFLKFFLLLLLATAGNVINAQVYLSTEAAVAALIEKNSEATEIIVEFQDNKNMDYYKAVATTQIIKSLIGQFKAGSSTAEVAENNSKSVPLNKVQRVTPMFPDSNGKYGSNWINEEILSLLEEQ